MRGDGHGMAAAANVPAILRLHRLAGKEGAAPPPVTKGSQGTGRGRAP